MNVFCYDATYDGLLCAVFDAYRLKLYPQALHGEGAILPMFAEVVHTVVTDGEKAQRVWRALEKKLSRQALNHIMYVWLSEEPGADMLIFRYIRKVVDSPRSIETHFADDDVTQMFKTARKVSKDQMFIKQFVRFQKTRDGIYFAAVFPQYNVLPLAIAHFRDRFADQQWAIYDGNRGYGFYYNLHSVEEIVLDQEETMTNGRLNADLLAQDDARFEALWRSYFKALSIKERTNLRQQRQFMPKRFWRYLPEMRDKAIV
ncbi:TIGR03915 family putative DNA repair protein [Enterobacillus tribolii]|uniref:Putative DNA metabolism protein n=1 Tax=Enterobacillus tribolii TaxID=1487935 RepID=A0A370QNN5_9GAMM|nr:TIGR03915 family putative DNA repair protein [Enterobacillus tribolii]MBW7982038.1 DNA metabolism protein [Enterobacillus tribolii]RDK89942.1 putative DNA metabolism protein [Enterobacillus tribolii]